MQRGAHQPFVRFADPRWASPMAGGLATPRCPAPRDCRDHLAARARLLSSRHAQLLRSRRHTQTPPLRLCPPREIVDRVLHPAHDGRHLAHLHHAHRTGPGYVGRGKMDPDGARHGRVGPQLDAAKDGLVRGSREIRK
jgi:hypothetical protein